MHKDIEEILKEVADNQENRHGGNHDNIFDNPFSRRSNPSSKRFLESIKKQ